MKVVCINAGTISNSDGIPSMCTDLIEGKIYTAEFSSKNIYGSDCYFISEINALRRCDRFKPIQDNWLENLLERITSESYIEECEPA